MKAAAAAALVAVLSGAPLENPSAATLDEQIDRVDQAGIAEAVSIGLAGDEAARARFHEPYVRRIGGPVLQSLEVVTEFRRMVILAEEQGRRGEAGWAIPLAASALAPFRGRLDLIAHLKFDPLNTYAAMPRVAMVIYTRGSAGGELQPLFTEATPQNVVGPVLPGTPILSARVESGFPAYELDPSRTYLVGLFVDGREIRRIPLDLSALR